MSIDGNRVRNSKQKYDVDRLGSVLRVCRPKAAFSDEVPLSLIYKAAPRQSEHQKAPATNIKNDFFLSISFTVYRLRILFLKSISLFPAFFSHFIQFIRRVFFAFDTKIMKFTRKNLRHGYVFSSASAFCAIFFLFIHFG